MSDDFFAVAAKDDAIAALRDRLAALERDLAAAVYHRDGARATVTHLEAEVERLREMVREAYSEGQGSVSWAGSTPFKDSSVAFDLAARREP
jgi:hypothetical protein